jgi:hypothetical protein
MTSTVTIPAAGIADTREALLGAMVCPPHRASRRAARSTARGASTVRPGIS